MTALKNEWFMFVQMEFRSRKVFEVFKKRTPENGLYVCATSHAPWCLSCAVGEFQSAQNLSCSRFRKGQQKPERDHRNKMPRIWRKKEGTAGKKLPKKRFMFLRSLIHLLFVRSWSLEHKAREDFS